MLNRVPYVLTALVGVGIVVAVGLAFASRSRAGGPPVGTPDAGPGLVGATPFATTTPRALPAVRGALVDPKMLIARIEAQGTSNGIALGTSVAELRKAGEVPTLRGRFVSDYPIWVVTVHGRFVPWSAPAGAKVPPLTKDIMFFDAYTGEGLGDLYSTETFTPRTPGAGFAVTPNAVDATEAAQAPAAP